MTTDLIVAHGEGWLVANKPAGLVVHPDVAGHADLISAVQNILKQDAALAKACGWNGEAELSVMHRLDREVSGLVLVATDQRIRKPLHAQFEDKSVEKTYVAVVEGCPLEMEGKWRKPLTKKAEGRQKPAGYPKMRVPCETLFKVLESSLTHALLELKPLSGRKHQLRRHCAIAGYPMVGDRRYGKDEQGELDRILLHAAELVFTDPGNQARVKVKVEPPVEFLQWL